MTDIKLHRLFNVRVYITALIVSRFIIDLFMAPLLREICWFGFEDDFYGEGNWKMFDLQDFKDRNISVL